MGLDEAFLAMADEDKLVEKMRDACDRLGEGSAGRYLEDYNDWD